MKDVIVGLQWGDEGKGKVVAFFSQFYDAVVRYSGGSNAGHTIEYNDEIKIVNHLLPSFYIKKSIELIISAGVVVDLEILYNEIENLKNKIEILPEIKISNLSHIVLPVHKKLDEKYDSVNKIGTTKRGIGPAFADRVNRLGIRIKDLENEKKLQKKIERISTIYEKIFGINFDFNDLKKFYNYLKPYITSQLEIIEDIKNKKVLFEGTQAVLLDLDMGTYPYVTGSNCSTSGVHSGIGFPVKLDNLLGVFKAYLTRVGNGPFPTELTGEEEELLRNKGKEFGATTGRPRRVGWLDLVLLKYAVSVSGVNEMIMTKALKNSSFASTTIMSIFKFSKFLITSSFSFNLKSPVSTKIGSKLSPIAFFIKTANTEESTPPDNPKITFPFPTVFLISSIFSLIKSFISQFFSSLAICSIKFDKIFVPY